MNLVVRAGGSRALPGAGSSWARALGNSINATNSIRRRAGIDRTPAVKKSTQGCEMATCLAQCGPGEDSTVNGGVVKGPGFKQRTANQPTQPTTIATKAEYQVATLCTHR